LLKTRGYRKQKWRGKQDLRRAGNDSSFVTHMYCTTTAMAAQTTDCHNHSSTHEAPYYRQFTYQTMEDKETMTAEKYRPFH
jgi:hypothetical protein